MDSIQHVHQKKEGTSILSVGRILSISLRTRKKRMIQWQKLFHCKVDNEGEFNTEFRKTNCNKFFQSKNISMDTSRTKETWRQYGHVWHSFQRKSKATIEAQMSFFLFWFESDYIAETKQFLNRTSSSQSPFCWREAQIEFAGCPDILCAQIKNNKSFMRKI